MARWKIVQTAGVSGCSACVKNYRFKVL